MRTAAPCLLSKETIEPRVLAWPFTSCNVIEYLSLSLVGMTRQRKERKTTKPHGLSMDSPKVNVRKPRLARVSHIEAVEDPLHVLPILLVLLTWNGRAGGH